MQKAKNIVRFTVHPYGAVLYFASTRKAFKKLRAHYVKDGRSLKGSLGACTDFEGGRVVLVGVFDGSIDTLTHEVAHGMIKILDVCGVPIDDHNSEAFCYLLGHWVGKLAPLNNGKKRS